MNCQLMGKLQGATQVNTVDLYTPNGSTKVYSCQTDAAGNFPTSVPTGQYKLKVNDSCWATSPDPMTLYLPLQFVTVIAPCTQ